MPGSTRSAPANVGVSAGSRWTAADAGACDARVRRRRLAHRVRRLSRRRGGARLHRRGPRSCRTRSGQGLEPVVGRCEALAVEEARVRVTLDGARELSRPARGRGRRRRVAHTRVCGNQSHGQDVRASAVVAELRVRARARQCRVSMVPGRAGTRAAAASGRARLDGLVVADRGGCTRREPRSRRSVRRVGSARAQAMLGRLRAGDAGEKLSACGASRRGDWSHRASPSPATPRT